MKNIILSKIHVIIMCILLKNFMEKQFKFDFFEINKKMLSYYTHDLKNDLMNFTSTELNEILIRFQDSIRILMNIQKKQISQIY